MVGFMTWPFPAQRNPSCPSLRQPMKRFALACAVAVLSLASVSAAAEDSVQIEYFPSYPQLDRSVPSTSIAISRQAGVNPSGTAPVLDRDVDAYFKAVSEALSEGSVTQDWEGGSALHAPIVRARIKLGDRSLTLTSGYRGGYLESARPGPDERNRRALGEILELSGRWIQQTIPSK